jgi:hypothetical protein
MILAVGGGQIHRSDEPCLFFVVMAHDPRPPKRLKCKKNTRLAAKGVFIFGLLEIEDI